MDKANDTCFFLPDDDEDSGGDFFSGIFENRPEKIISIIFSAVGGSILMPLVYGIIWFEHHGSDLKRTLLNKLVSSLCWSCMEWFFIIQLLDMVRYIYGPLPAGLCLFNLHLRFAIFTQQMLFMDGIILTRYVFIFCLRNPFAFNDDFWYLVINIWIVAFSFMNQVVMALMPGRSTLYFYICSGRSPLKDQDIPAKVGLAQQLLTVVSILLHIYVLIKIHLYNKKVTITQTFRSTFAKMSIFKNSLSDLTTCFCTTILGSVVVIFTWKANQVPVKDFNCYPNYLYEYFFRMMWPIIFGFTLVLLYYFRNEKLRSTIAAELRSAFQDLKPLQPE